VSLNVEVLYDRESWWTIVVDETERQAGDKLWHDTRAKAIEAAKQYGLPVHIYTKAHRLLIIKEPPF